MIRNEAYYRDKMIASGIPAYMHDGLLLYLLQGRLPGHFLTAILSNNLSEAVGRADIENEKALPGYVRFLYNYVPGAAWGSPGKVETWIASFSVTAPSVMGEFESEEV